MPFKYAAVREEDTYRTVTPGNATIAMKLLRESVNSERTDFFPENIEKWIPDDQIDGYFGTSGDVDILLDPIVWPKLLVLLTHDPSSSPAQGGGPYDHTFKFGASEIMTPGGAGIKPFNLAIGVGIERDRLFLGNVIESMDIDIVAREVCSSTVGIFGSGKEILRPAYTPSYAAYTQPYFSFKDVATMTIGGTDRLTTAPEIEAFHLSLGRSYDTDHYVLGDQFVPYPKLSGMGTVEGSVELAFQSEDEHERFLQGVGSYIVGDQSSFAMVLELEGETASGAMKYEIEFTLPECYYTSSEVNVEGRDRIVQTLDFRGNYNSTAGCACQIRVRNMTSSYTTLA